MKKFDFSAWMLKRKSSGITKKNLKDIAEHQKMLRIVTGIHKLCHSTKEGISAPMSIDISKGRVEFRFSIYRSMLTGPTGLMNKSLLANMLNGIRCYCGFMRSYTNGLHDAIGKERPFAAAPIDRLEFDIKGDNGQKIFTGWQSPGNLFYRECFSNEEVEECASRVDVIEKLIATENKSNK